MKIKQVDNFSDFMALEERWTKVLQKSNHTVFQTWEWLTTWWKYFGNGRRLLILLAEENDEIIGIAPFMYSVYKMFGARQGNIEFIGCEHSCYNDFILASRHNECVNMFVDYINDLDENWNYLKLTDIPENGNSLKPLSNLTKSISFAHLSFYTKLPISYDGLLNWINRKDRKELKRNLRRLEDNNFKVGLSDYSDTESITDGLKILISLHQERWKVKGGFSGMFADPRFCRFILEVANRFSQKGWLGLYSFELSGKAVGSLCGFKYMSKYYAYLEGLDSRYLKYSVGNLLFLHTMAKCIQEGMLEFDFLWGTDFYKKKWNPIPKQTSNAIIIKNGKLATMRYSIYSKYWNGGILLNRYLRKYKKNSPT